MHRLNSDIIACCVAHLPNKQNRTTYHTQYPSVCTRFITIAHLLFSLVLLANYNIIHNANIFPITFPSEQEQRPMLPLAPNYHFQWHNPRSPRVCHHHRRQIVSLVVTPKNCCCCCRYKMPLDCNCEIRDETFVTTLRNDR